MLGEILAWTPLVLILGAALWMGVYQMRSYGRHVDRVQKINDEILQINREAIAELRQIKQILKDQK